MTTMRYSSLAVAGGTMLAVMISINSSLAAHSTPLFASWAAHGIGAAVAAGLMTLIYGLTAGRSSVPRSAQTGTAGTRQKAPLWAYLGGLPGSMTVVLAAITVNSVIGLPGTLALGLVGQVLFGLVADQFGLFGMPRRKLLWNDAYVVGLVVTGSTFIIFSRA